MSVIPLLIAAGLLIALGFLGAFWWAVRSGQYDDTYTPSIRILHDEPNHRQKSNSAPTAKHVS